MCLLITPWRFDEPVSKHYKVVMPILSMSWNSSDHSSLRRINGHVACVTVKLQ